MAAGRTCDCRQVSCFTCHRRYTLQKYRHKYNKNNKKPEELVVKKQDKKLTALDIMANEVFKRKGWD